MSGWQQRGDPTLSMLLIDAAGDSPRKAHDSTLAFSSSGSLLHGSMATRYSDFRIFEARYKYSGTCACCS